MSEKFGVNANTVNAIVSSIGALAMVLTRQLTDQQREAVCSDLSRLAALAERNGDTALETMLIDLHRSVR